MVLKVTVSPDLVGGDVDEGYGKVADAFRANFASGQEVGAAIAVYRNGVKVVDLWGGYRDGVTKAPWRHDTMVNMFSTTKGVAALAVALAVSRGLFGYDDKVVDHWPEFAQAGKADVTIRQLLGHQAGLCVLKPAPTVRDVADPARLSVDARGPEAGVATGHSARIPRDHAGLVRIRAHPSDRPGRPHTGPLPRRRDCRAHSGWTYISDSRIRWPANGSRICTTGRARNPYCTSMACRPASSPRRSTRSDCSPVPVAFRAT